MPVYALNGSAHRGKVIPLRRGRKVILLKILKIMGDALRARALLARAHEAAVRLRHPVTIPIAEPYSGP